MLVVSIPPGFVGQGAPWVRESVAGHTRTAKHKAVRTRLFLRPHHGSQVTRSRLTELA